MHSLMLCFSFAVPCWTELLRTVRQLYTTINAFPLPSEATLANPSQVSVLPFLWADLESVPQRMSLTANASGVRSFSFMGRCKMAELLSTIRSLRNGSLIRRLMADEQAFNVGSAAAASASPSAVAATIIVGQTLAPTQSMYQGQSEFAKLLVYGTPGWGKSYMMAAAAAVLQRDFLMKRSHLRVVYLPDCGQLRERPVACMQQALLLAFADDEVYMRQILQCETCDSLVKFVDSVPRSHSLLLFLADQTNKLTGKVGTDINPEKERKKAIAYDLLGQVSFSHFRVEAISINDSNKEDVQQKQENRLEMPVFGEMSQVSHLLLVEAKSFCRFRNS
jgi:hypothetical protein